MWFGDNYMTVNYSAIRVKISLIVSVCDILHNQSVPWHSGSTFDVPMPQKGWKPLHKSPVVTIVFPLQLVFNRTVTLKEDPGKIWLKDAWIICSQWATREDCGFVSICTWGTTPNCSLLSCTGATCRGDAGKGSFLQTWSPSSDLVTPMRGFNSHREGDLQAIFQTSWIIKLYI